MMFRSSFFSPRSSALFPAQTILQQTRFKSSDAAPAMLAHSSDEPSTPLIVNIRHIGIVSAILGNMVVAPIVVGAGYPIQRLTVAFQSGELTSILKNVSVIKRSFPSQSFKRAALQWYLQGIWPVLKNAPISKGSFMGPVFAVNAWKGTPEDEGYQLRSTIALPIACVVSSVSQAAVQFPARVEQLNKITNVSQKISHKQFLKPNYLSRLYVPWQSYMLVANTSSIALCLAFKSYFSEKLPGYNSTLLTLMASLMGAFTAQFPTSIADTWATAKMSNVIRTGIKAKKSPITFSIIASIFLGRVGWKGVEFATQFILAERAISIINRLSEDAICKNNYIDIESSNNIRPN